jgi:hypothetical protein
MLNGLDKILSTLGGVPREPRTPPFLPPSSPSPNLPAGPVGGPAPSAGQPQDKIARLQAILKFAVPAIAAAYSMKSGGGADGFARGYAGQENAFQEQQIRRDQLAEQKRARMEQEARQARADAMQAEAAQRALERQVAEDKAREDARIASVLRGAMGKAAENPAFMEKVNSAGAESFSITVPGLGPINVKEAFDRLGVIADDEGKYIYGKPREPKKKVPYRVDKGEATYEQMVDEDDPRLSEPHVVSRTTPKEPKSPTTRAYTIKDDDPASDTFGKSFRITEDAQGNIISRKMIELTDSSKPASAPAPTGTQKKIGRFIVEQ